MSTFLRITKKIMIIILGIVLLLVAATFLYMQQAKFGKASEGKRAEIIAKSPNFKDGKFQNIQFTPNLSEGYTMAGIVYNQFFKEFPRRKPVDSIPSVKTDLLQLPADTNVLVWFGHSSYFMQIDGKRLLVDPVFSGNASPIPGTNTSFKGTDIYTAADMPPIDYLLITHDHYDHLDYETIMALKGKVKTVVCGLGVGAHFEYWGFNPGIIIEKDWNEQLVLDDGFTLYTAPTRHFSGRGFVRNNTLWLSYILQTPSLKIYMGGDSGYDTHFAEIGKQHGPIDLAILDNGQYNIAWQAIHMLPEEVLKATADLKAKRLFPVHSSKFILGQHPWDEPLIKITELNSGHQFPLVTPMIGQRVNLNDSAQSFSAWWEGVN